MTKQYDNTNRGVVFKNQRKAKETHPDYTGSLNIEGEEYFLDMWIKEGQKGKFFSCSIKKKDKQPQAPKRHGDRPGGAFNKPSTGFDDMDSDIPW